MFNITVELLKKGNWVRGASTAWKLIIIIIYRINSYQNTCMLFCVGPSMRQVFQGMSAKQFLLCLNVVQVSMRILTKIYKFSYLDTSRYLKEHFSLKKITVWVKFYSFLLNHIIPTISPLLTFLRSVFIPN